MLKTVITSLAVLSICCPTGQASAEGLFDFLFGRAPATSAIPQVSQPVEKNDSPAVATRPKAPERFVAHESIAPRRSGAYCVRLCDGRFFPLQPHRGVTPTQLCNAHCPATQTKVFSGSEIGRAVASDGTRYAGLENAFAYRNRIVPACTCNGKSHFGLAPINIPADPTLRAGDIVVTAHGRVVTGDRSATEATSFTPTGGDRGRSAGIRQALASQERTPVPQ
jgi:hypothetical protein